MGTLVFCYLLVEVENAVHVGLELVLHVAERVEVVGHQVLLLGPVGRLKRCKTMSRDRRDRQAGTRISSQADIQYCFNKHTDLILNSLFL